MTAIRVMGILSLCALVTVGSICRADPPPQPDAQPSNRAAAVHSPRKTVMVNPKVLDAYVGQYELAPKVILVLSRQNRHLFAQITGQPILEVFPESETTFFWKVVDMQFAIQRDKDGNVVGLAFGRGDQKAIAKRISGQVPPEEDVPERAEHVQSPRLAALTKETETHGKPALERFWNEMRDKTPLVEPIPGETRDSFVTFLWRGNQTTRRVCVSGGLPTGERDKPLARLDDTDVWYRTERIPNDSRFVYGFQVNWPSRLPEDQSSLMQLMPRLRVKLDPLNPRDVTIQSKLRSLVELPKAPRQPWVDRLEDVPIGTLLETKITSNILKQEREFAVYTPARYDSSERGTDKYRLLIIFDGPSYQSNDEIPAQVILDNLIAKAKIPPTVAVFVKHIDRNRDLACSEPFADFVAKELIPWTRKNYDVSHEPGQTIVGGLSQGGLMAAYCGLRHADVVGNVLSLSGSYQWFPGARDETGPNDGEPGWLTRQYAATPHRPIRFYLQAGRFEDSFPLSLLAENRRFRDVLQAKGYSVQYSELNGAHDFQAWRGAFAEGLIELSKRHDGK